MSSCRSPSRNWTVQELIFICLLIQRKRTGFCILFTNSSFHTLVGPWRISTKDIYEFLQVTITKLNCARTDIYLFVTHMDSREQKIIHISFHTVVRIKLCKNRYYLFVNTKKTHGLLYSFYKFFFPHTSGSMKNLYKGYLWVLTGHHHEIELCKNWYLFVCDTHGLERTKDYTFFFPHSSAYYILLWRAHTCLVYI